MSVVLRSGGEVQYQRPAQTITRNGDGEVLIRIGGSRTTAGGNADINASYRASLDHTQHGNTAAHSDPSSPQYHVTGGHGGTTATHTIYTKTSSSVMHRGSPETSAVSYTTRHLTSSKSTPTDDSGPATNGSHILVNTNINSSVPPNNVDKREKTHRHGDTERHSLYTANSTTDSCFSCHRAIYQPDRVGPLRGVMYHGLCFRCASCGTQLTLKTFWHNNSDMEDERVFCKSHQPSVEYSTGDMSYHNIQAVINKPKLTPVNLNIRGAPIAGHIKGYGADAVVIRRAMNVPKLETYNQTVRPVPTMAYNGHTM